MQVCPEEALLQRCFVDQDLDDATGSLVEEHVECCAACQTNVERLIGSNTTRDGGMAAVRVEIKQLRIAVPRSPEIAIRFPLPPTSHGALGQLDIFHVQEQLGGGTYGVVYRVFDEKLACVRALKVLRPEWAVIPALREKFLQEARAAAAVRHPSVVNVHTVHATTALFPQPYLVMEYVEGSSLTLHWKARTPRRMTAKEAVRMVREVAEGLSAAHGRGVIHRDVKPDNILMEKESGRARLADFGVARLSEAVQLSSAHASVIGTPAYMSPEAFEQPELVDARSDLFSLGVVLHQALTGRLPFSGSTRDEIERAVQGMAPIQLPSEFRKNASMRDLAAITEKMLARKQEDRYQTAREVVADLDCWERGELVPVRQHGIGERGIVWARHHPARATLMGAALLLLCATLMATLGFTAFLREKLIERTEELLAQQAKSDQIKSENQERIRRNAYLSDLQLAFQTRQGGEWRGTREVLQRQVPKEGETDWRGFEWDLLDQACSIEPRVLTLPNTGMSVSFSPTGTLACAGEFDKVLLWELATEKVKSLPLASNQGAKAAFSATGEIVACIDHGGSVHLWNSKGQSLQSPWNAELGPLALLAFSPAGPYLAVGGGDIKIWNWPGSNFVEAVKTIPANGRVRAMAYGPSGETIASASFDGGWKVWDILHSNVQLRVDHPREIRSITYSANGRIVFTGDISGTVIAWETNKGQRMFTLGGHQGTVRCLATFPDGRHIASGSDDGTIRVWDLARQNVRAVLRRHTKEVSAIAISPDGRHLASTGHDGIACVWDVTRLTAWESLQASIPTVERASFNPEGTILALACTDNNLHLIDVETMRETRRLTGLHQPVLDMALSAESLTVVQEDHQMFSFKFSDGMLRRNGTILPSAFALQGRWLAYEKKEGLICVNDLLGDSKNKEIESRSKRPGLEHISKMTLSHDGRLVAAAHREKIAIWTTPKLDPEQITASVTPTYLSHKDFVQTFALAHDGKRLASATVSGEVLLWSLVDKSILGKCRDDPAVVSIRGLEFSPGDRYLSGIEVTGNFTRNLLLWDATSRRLVKRFEGVRQYAFASAGTHLAVVLLDGRVFVWDLANWKMRTVEGQQQGVVHSLAFSADNARLYSASLDPPAMVRSYWGFVSGFYDQVIPGSTGASIRVWDLRDRRQVRALITPDWVPVFGMAGSTECDFLAAGGRGGWIQCWRGRDLVERPSFFPDPEAENAWKTAAFLVNVGNPSYLNTIRTIATSPKGRFIATVCETRKSTKDSMTAQYTMQLWDQSGKELGSTGAGIETSPEFSHPVVAFSPQEDVLVFTEKEAVRFMDVPSGKVRQVALSTGQRTKAVAFSRDGKLLAAGGQDRKIWLWDLASRKLLRSWFAHGEAVTALTFAADNKTLASGSYDTTVKLWAVPGGELLGSLDGPTGKVHALAFSPRGDVLASGGENGQQHGEILLWHIGARQVP